MTGAEPRRAGRLWIAGAVVGLLGSGVALSLPGAAEVLGGRGVMVVVALAGAALLVVVSRRGGSDRDEDVCRVERWVGALGTAVLANPILLGLSAANVGGGVVDGLANAAHVPALTLVQLVPVVAAARAVRRSGRGWLVAIVLVAVVNLLLAGATLATGGSPALAVIGSGLWLGSFALPPIATWTLLHRTSGETRRRAVVAAVAALTPVVIISYCMTLALMAERVGWGDSAFTALYVGFAVSTFGCGALALAAVRAPSAVLRPSVLVTTLNVLIAVLILLFAVPVLIATSSSGMPSTLAVVVGAALGVVVALPWLFLHRWTRRVVDPTAELRHELEALGPLAAGREVHVTQQVLRRVVDDPSLVVEFDPAPAPPDGSASNRVALARDASGVPTVVALGSLSESRERLARLGDCTTVLQPALLADRATRASRRADEAAESERRRVAHDLHDGLQGRMLGLALQIQLASRQVDDTLSRLVLDDTVASLGSLVDDVRALGGGSLPTLLVDEGLTGALGHLLRPMTPLVTWEVPSMRLRPLTEATAYFVISEAVANALKHSSAEHIRVTVSEPRDDLVTVAVHDDGSGGADPRLGSGLRGLSERVVSAGGLLVVRDDVTGGTVVEAVLPCAS